MSERKLYDTGKDLYDIMELVVIDSKNILYGGDYGT